MSQWAHEIDVVPAFVDLDPMGIVWHGHYARYLELARCALLQRYDYDYPQMRASGYSWPIVEMRMKYVRSITYGQTLRVRAEIVEWQHRLKIAYGVREAASGQKIHEAHTIQVAIDMRTQNMCYASPDVLLQRLGVTR